MSQLKIPRLRSGGLITNYFCPSRCAHCLYNCGPTRSRDYIHPDTAKHLLRTVRKAGCPAVHIGGGEPFLDPEGLGRVLRRMPEAGVGLEYVETNGSWYRNEESAVALLNELRSQGLHTLLLSVSPFHNERIPASRITGALQAARRAGVSVIPWVDGFFRDLAAFAPDRPHSLQEYMDHFGRDYPMQILRRYWIHFGGRALETFRPLLPGQSPERILKEAGDCSRDLQNTGHFHVDLYGSYIPGLCSGLAIDAEDLGRPLSEEKYPLLTALHRCGVAGLKELAEKDMGYIPQRESYLNACDLCTEIRAFLVRSGSTAWAELSPREFYDPLNI